MDYMLLEQFSHYLKRRNNTSRTRIAYSFAVKQYFEHSKTPYLSVESLLDYKQWLIKTYAVGTVNLRICAVNQYLLFLKSDAAYSNLNPDAENYKLQAVAIQKKSYLDSVITKQDYQRLKKGLKNDHNYSGYFMVRYLAGTGARVSELIQIKAEHLTLGYMDLYSKGGKIRRIYFPDALVAETLVWLKENHIDSGFIFLNRRGKQITPRGINICLKRYARQYKVPSETVYAHSFRHFFAKNFLKRFSDISLLADLMGHESIETTRIYLKKTSIEQQELIDRIVTW